MLNQVHVEGYVTKRVWQYDGDTFVRLATYRDQDRPRKKLNGGGPDERDQPDYVTVRVPPTAMPIVFKAGQRIQVHGWLESQSQKFTLADFLEAASGAKPEIDAAQAQEIAAHRDFTRVVAERIVALPKSKN